MEFSLLIESNSGCDGKLPGRDGEGCCTTSNTCKIGEGDCDSDSECTGNLVCGTDNCLSIFGHSPSDFDCCEEGKKTLCMCTNHLFKKSRQFANPVCCFLVF